MKLFKVSVTAYVPVPRTRDYEIEATSFGTAIGRAIKNYRKDIGQKRIDQMSVKAIK